MATIYHKRGNYTMVKNHGQGKTRGAGRTRNWTFLVYPESAPANWRDILDEEHVQWIESPLHDKDTNADGEIKKAHYHILIMFESVKTYEQVLEITERMNATIPQKCNGTKGLVRYMVHLDNPEKFQYLKSEIIGHGGADVMELLKPTTSDRYGLIKEMIEYVKENEVDEIQDLIDYSIQERSDDWFPLLCDNSAYVVSLYIKSVRHRSRR